jgi:hypothetical protein
MRAETKVNDAASARTTVAERRCFRCRAEGAAVVTFVRIWSAATRHEQAYASFLCPSCAQRQARLELIVTAIGGWWGWPGIFRTPGDLCAQLRHLHQTGGSWVAHAPLGMIVPAVLTVAVALVVAPKPAMPLDPLGPGLAALRERRFPAARQLLADAYQLQPEPQRALALASCMQAQGEHEGALALAVPLASKPPWQQPALRLIATSELAQLRPHAAIVALERLSLLAPDDSSILREWYGTLDDLDHHAECQRLLTRTIARNNALALEARFLAAEQAMRDLEPAAAIEQLRAVLLATPRRDDAWLLLLDAASEAHLTHQRFTALCHEIERAANAPGASALVAILAVTDAATRRARLQNQPPSIARDEALVRLLLAAGASDEARKLLVARPTSWARWAGIELAVRAGDLALAQQLLARRTSPANARWRQLLDQATFIRASGDSSQAARLLADARAAIAPESRRTARMIQRSLARALRESGQFAAAATALAGRADSLPERHQDRSRVLREHVLIALESGQHDSALAWMRSASEPSNERDTRELAHVLMALVLLERGQHDQALRSLAPLLQRRDAKTPIIGGTFWETAARRLAGSATAAELANAVLTHSSAVDGTAALVEALRARAAGESAQELIAAGLAATRGGRFPHHWLLRLQARSGH